MVTEADGDATEAGAEAARDGCDRLFVARGDGTLNEVLNGVASVVGGLSAVTLGVIPLGTGNDFASAIDGEHVEDERVTYVRTRGLDLAFDRRIAINTDGQVLEADRCGYEVLPGVIRALIP